MTCHAKQAASLDGIPGAFFTFVYIRQEGGWRLVSLHLSPQK